MAIDLTTTLTGIFPRIGKILGGINELNTYLGNGTGSGTFDVRITTLNALFATVDPQLDDGLYPLRDATFQSVAGFTAAMKALATQVVVQRVNDDRALPSLDLTTALQRILAQMNTATTTYVAAGTAPAGTVATVTPGPTGTGLPVVALVDPNNNPVYNCFAEVADIVCTADSYTGGATLGQEKFTYKTPPVVSDTLSPKWPGGSGVSINLTAVDATVDNGANKLTNSDFESFTSNAPNKWVIITGVAGTNFFADSSGPLTGTTDLKITANSSDLPEIRQQFNNSAGTLGTLLPDTVYLVSVWMKKDSGTTGVIKFSLKDGSGTAVSPDNGTNVKTVDLSTLITSYTNTTFAFVTPRNLPSSGVRFAIELTTALNSAHSVYIDQLAMTPGTVTYKGGPVVAIFSGATPFVLNDTFKVTYTNGTNATTSLLRGFDRLFDMRGKGLVFPVSGSTLINDNLIS